MPTVRVSDTNFRRLQRYAQPLVDSFDDALSRVLDLAETNEEGIKPVMNRPSSQEQLVVGRRRRENAREVHVTDCPTKPQIVRRRWGGWKQFGNDSSVFEPTFDAWIDRKRKEGSVNYMKSAHQWAHEQMDFSHSGGCSYRPD